MSTQAERERMLEALQRRMPEAVWRWWCAQSLHELRGSDAAMAMLTPAQARAMAKDLMARWTAWARMRLEARLAAAGMRPAAARWVSRRLPGWLVARLVQ